MCICVHVRLVDWGWLGVCLKEALNCMCEIILYICFMRLWFCVLFFVGILFLLSFRDRTLSLEPNCHTILCHAMLCYALLSFIYM